MRYGCTGKDADTCKVHRVAEHGTESRYRSRTHPCRCEDCRRADSAYQRRYTNRPCGKGEGCGDHVIHAHGTLDRYRSRTHPCRCQPCKGAMAAYCRAKRSRAEVEVSVIPVIDPIEHLQVPEGWGRKARNRTLRWVA